MKLIEISNHCRRYVYMSSIRFINDWISTVRNEVSILMLLQRSEWDCVDVLSSLYVKDVIDEVNGYKE